MESVESGLTAEDDESSEMVAGAATDVTAGVVVAFSDVEVAGWSFFSFSLASSPSTLFNRASKTSVLGPRFFGTASGQRKWAHNQFLLYSYFVDPGLEPPIQIEHTIDARALENLTGLT